jgi:hypothetical protein
VVLVGCWGITHLVLSAASSLAFPTGGGTAVLLHFLSQPAQALGNFQPKDPGQRLLDHAAL